VSEHQVLRDECLQALLDYVRQAQGTCELLGNIEGTSLPLDRLLAILEHTQAEDEILKSYMVLRQRLFDVLIGTELHDGGSSRAASNPPIAK
jgi:hypothetical protein